MHKHWFTHELGTEFEFVWAPDTPTAARINRILCNRYGACSTEYEEVIGKLLPVLSTAAPSFVYEIEEEKMSGHHAMTEFKFRHCSLREWYTRLGRMTQFFKTLRSYGYVDTLGVDGTHFNLDVSMFDSEALNNFLWFSFYNSEFVVSFLNRRYYYSAKSDMYSFLNDVLRIKTRQHTLKGFKIRRDRFVNNFLDGKPDIDFGLHMFKEGRKTIEVRWGGSTLDPVETLANVTYMFYITEFCREATSYKLMTLPNFCEFVMAKTSMVSPLLEKLRSNKHAKQYCKQ